LISKSNGQQQLGRLVLFFHCWRRKKFDFTWYAFLDTTILWVWPLETFLKCGGEINLKNWGKIFRALSPFGSTILTAVER
jgi:hypothetical protein